jgi:uncharacterized protein
MLRRLLLLLALLPLCAAPETRPARVLAFYSKNVEADHVEFAVQAVRFYTAEARRGKYQLEISNSWDDLNVERLEGVDLVLWLNDSPGKPEHRAAFEQYMEHGGGWIGYHAAGYNDAGTKWPWFVRFLGGAVFYGNNWPPLPGKLTVDDRTTLATKGVPASFVSPDNEWYSWWPDPRADKDVRVLMTLDPSNFPIGLKDTISGGDVPVVWTNTKYRMMYINMGHGDKIFSDATQNRFLADAVRWALERR